LFRVVAVSSCETEVAYFEFAVCVDQEIAWLQIAMEDICRVNVFEATENLIDERLIMRISQRLTRADDGVEICFEKLNV
jgi:hypothetical protein